MKFCPHCGKELTAQTSFCPHCGKSLTELENTSKQDTVSTNPGNADIRLYIAIVLNVVIAIMFAFDWFEFRGLSTLGSIAGFSSLFEGGITVSGALSAINQGFANFIAVRDSISADAEFFSTMTAAFNLMRFMMVMLLLIPVINVTSALSLFIRKQRVRPFLVFAGTYSSALTALFILYVVITNLSLGQVDEFGIASMLFSISLKPPVYAVVAMGLACIFALPKQSVHTLNKYFSWGQTAMASLRLEKNVPEQTTWLTTKKAVLLLGAYGIIGVLAPRGTETIQECLLAGLFVLLLKTTSTKKAVLFLSLATLMPAITITVIYRDVSRPLTATLILFCTPVFLYTALAGLSVLGKKVKIPEIAIYPVISSIIPFRNIFMNFIWISIESSYPLSAVVSLLGIPYLTCVFCAFSAFATYLIVRRLKIDTDSYLHNS